MSPGDLEGKVKWLDNYQKVKQLRDTLVWLPVWERDKRAFVPEVCLIMCARALSTERSVKNSHRYVPTPVPFVRR